jgi:RNA-binding protein
MLTSKQRGFLSSLAVSIQPTVMIGKEGASEAVVRALQAEFKHRELVKLRFQDSKDQRKELARSLSERTGSELVRVIGNVAVFYLRAADPEKRGIEFPS